MGTTKCKFHKLTPTKDAELNVYADALDYVFSDDDIKNIAITGPYSSGKSSMLETYKAANKDKTFIHISLAHFETATLSTIDSEDDSKENNQSFEANTKTVEIEGKILNQLIHQIDEKKIPQTHFKIKRPFSKRSMQAMTAIFTMFVALIIFLLNRNTWLSFVNGMTPSWLKFLFYPTTTDLFVIGTLLICGTVTFWGLLGILKLQHNKNLLRRLSVQGNEIEIFEKDEDSFFNKHLNEVLYLFRNTKADAIVFEDMDRYNSNQIFEKLREINYLLNNSPNNHEEKVFRFFYLLRDDIFKSKDRTKFFDFIIPVVPVIVGANSYDKFIEYFNDGGILESFDSSFLQEISMYIDDMRLLKNIYNEYRVYYDRIQLTELSCNKLLAMIAYKNLFPRDFSELQLGKGYVFCLFRNKDLFIHAEIDSIEKRIVEINDLLQKAEKEHLKSIDELDLIFFEESGYIYDVSGRGADSFPSNSDFVREMRTRPNEVYRWSNNYSRHRSDVKPIFDKMQTNSEYLERRKAIENKASQINSTLTNQLYKLNNRKKELESATLSEIIQISQEMAAKVFASTYTDEINNIYKYEDIKGSLYFPLIKYLVRNKHIDENYPDYMSYFYEQSISRIDQIFVRSVFDVEAKPFTYALKDAALVASKISPRYYSQPEVLNFDLFAFLLKTQHENLSPFLKQLRDNRRVDFALEFWQSGREKRQLLHDVNNVWPEIWQTISQTDTISAEDKNKYLIDTFYYSPHKDLERMNIDGIITKHISTCSSFISIAEPKVSLVVEALDFLKVCFEGIDYKVCNKELFNAVYSNNLYKINKSTIFMILENVYQIVKNEDFYHKNYSLILTRPDEPLVAYVEENMDSYISFVFDICDGSISDDEVNAIAILNHTDVEQTYKERYINALTTEIEQLESINDSGLWSLLLSQYRIPCSIANILSYYFDSGNGFDDILTDFTNESELDKGLSYTDVVNNHGKEQAIAFYKSLITNNALDNEKYTSLLSTSGISYPQFSFEDIKDDKVRILINLKIIKMNTFNLTFIRENYSNCKMHFIFENIDEYSQNVISEENSNFDLFELKHLLKKKVADENLLRLLRFTNEPISIAGKSVSDVVKKYILENNYHGEDLSLLISNYETESSEIKAIVLALCVEEIEQIVNGGIKTPYSLLIALLQSAETLNKRGLLAGNLRDLTREQAIECFTSLKMSNLLTVFNGKWPSIKIDDDNTLILKIMKEKRWISSFAEDEYKPDYYRVRARRNIDSDDKLPHHLL
ncbi:MAG TPA: hypothetical protein GX497_02955 [Bacillus bacterium]|nr:hypothetical protein [Bacillus sp. (in: firmicutes)]